MSATGARPVVFATVHDDGSVDFTVSIDDEDHRFSAAADGENAVLSYQETQSWRAQRRIKSPREEVWEHLMKSDEMTEYLDAHGLESVRRDDKQ